MVYFQRYGILSPSLFFDSLLHSLLSFFLLYFQILFRGWIIYCLIYSFTVSLSISAFWPETVGSHQPLMTIAIQSCIIWITFIYTQHKCNNKHWITLLCLSLNKRRRDFNMSKGIGKKGYLCYFHSISTVLLITFLSLIKKTDRKQQPRQLWYAFFYDKTREGTKSKTKCSSKIWSLIKEG